MIYKYFLPVDELHFHFVDGFLSCAEPFGFMLIHLFIFAFVAFVFDVKFKKSLSKTMSRRLLPVFSSRSFTVLGLMFKSLIHFELIIVYGVREWFSFILLHVTVQFSQHHLLKRLFPIVYSCFFCHKLIDHACMDLFS